MAKDIKPLTEAQQQYMAHLNGIFLRAKQTMDAFTTYLRTEHEAPAGEWVLRNILVGFERVPKPQEKPTRRTKRRSKKR